MDLATLLTQAEAQLLQYGTHPPTLIVALEGLPNPIRQTLTPFPGTSQQREDVLYLKGRQFAHQHGHRRIQRAWFICEAWMSVMQPNAPTRIAPSLDPRRREVVFVIELDATSTVLSQQCGVREIKRAHSGKIRELLPITDLSTDEKSQDLSGVLLLCFLDGFAQASSQEYGQLRNIILQHRYRLENF